MAAVKERRRVQHEPGRRIGQRAVPGVHIATAREGKALFDRQAQELLNISGDEFLRRWDDGVYRRLADTPEDRKVRRLAMLLPFARRTTG